MIYNVIEYLKRAAQKNPDKVAFVDQDKKITFQEMDYRARQVAIAIKEKLGDVHNQPIAVYEKKGVDCLIAFFGVLYSGNFYSPIDESMPIDRIKVIMDTLNPKLIIYGRSLENNKISDCSSIIIDETESIHANNICVDGFKQILDIDPIYTLFTSGSTGIPKGVVISHRGVIDYIEWLATKFEFDESTIFGNQAPFYFDNSILDIYSTIRNHSTMIILPQNSFVFSKVLEAYMNDYKINTIFWVPSALVGLANSDALSKVHFSHLKKILFCGEVMPNKQLNYWRRHYPNNLFVNMYGPTEITDVCTYYIVDRQFEDDESLPIGKACENTQVLILTEDNQVAKIGEEGELCVRGIGVSMGYYANEQKSEEKFIQNPTNTKYRDIIYKTGDVVKQNERGEIIYIGRTDFQIKKQGHRIELGEVESAASSLEEVGMSGAIFDEEKEEIVLFCTTNVPSDKKTIYQALKKKIPHYMLPSKIEIIDEMPLNMNGKIDRIELKKNWGR